MADDTNNTNNTTPDTTPNFTPASSETPLYTAAMGEHVSASERQMNRDFRSMTAQNFALKYGNDALRSYREQLGQIRQAAPQNEAARTRTITSPLESPEEFGDAVRGFLTGAVTGVTGMASVGLDATGYIAELPVRAIQSLTGDRTPNRNPLRDAAASLSEITEGISKWNEENASEISKMSTESYQNYQRAFNDSANREYKDDLARGVPETQAKLAREGKLFASGISAALRSGHYQDVISSGVGSTVSTLPVGGALGKVLGATTVGKMLANSAGSRAVEKLADTALSAEAKALVATTAGVKANNAAGWMLASGLMEGSGSFTQTLNETREKIADMSTEELLAEPVAASLIAQFRKQGYSADDAEKMTREYLPFMAARTAGAITGVAATGLGYLTRNLFEPFGEFTKRTGKGFGSYTLGGFSEVGEETGTGIASQMGQNIGTKLFVDRNQDILEGVGESSAMDALGATGMSGPRLGSGLVRDSLNAAVKGTRATVTAGRDAYRENFTDASSKPETIQKNLDTLKNTDYTTVNLPDNIRQDLSSVSENLQTIGNQVLHPDTANGNSADNSSGSNAVPGNSVDSNATDTVADNTGNGNNTNTSDGRTVSNPFIQGLEHINRITEEEERANRHHTSNTEEAKTLRAQKATISNTATGLKNYVIGSMRSAIQEARKSYSKDGKLTADQLKNEAAYFSALDAVDHSKAVREWNTLPKNVQSLVQSASFVNDASVQAGMNKFLGSKARPETQFPVVRTGTDQLAERAAATEAETTANNTNSAVTVSRHIRPEFEAVPQEQRINASTNTSPTVREENLDDSGTAALGTREDGTHYYRSGSLKYDIPSDLVEKLSNEETFNEALNELSNRISANIPEYNIAQDGQTQLIYTPDRGTNSLIVSNANGEYLLDIEDVSPELIQKLSDPSIPEEERNQLLLDEYNKGTLSDARQALSLRNPKALERVGKYLDEDGNIRDYAQDEVQKSFTEKVGEAFTKLFRPVRRAMYLMLNDSPRDTLTDLLLNPEKMREYLKSNQLTNADTLYNQLYAVNGKVPDEFELDSERAYNPNDSIAQQIISLMNENGVFMKQFTQAFEDVFAKNKDKLPEDLKAILLDSEGNIKPAMMDIIKIASIHAVPLIRSRRHEMNANEFMRRGLNLEVQDKDFSTLGGTARDEVLQSLANSIRQIMGVNPVNSTTDLQTAAVFGPMAAMIADSLIQAEVIEEKTIQVNDPVRDANGRLQDNYIDFVLYEVDENLGRVFGPKADAILRILNPTMRNSYLTAPVAAKKTINGTSAPISAEVEQALNEHNQKAAVINIPFAGFLHLMGGKLGIDALLGQRLDKFNRYEFVGKDWDSKEGQGLSRQLAFDWLTSLIDGNFDNPLLNSIKTFFSHVALRNGRSMAEGAATYQNNKLVRELAFFANSDSYDLTNQNLLHTWKAAMAQSLGKAVGNTQDITWLPDVEKLLDVVREEYPSMKPLLDQMNQFDLHNWYNNVTEEQAKANRDQWNQYLQKIEKKTGFKAEDFRSQNALIEALRFVEAEQNNALDKFVSRVYLENDGKADGSSNTNATVGLAMRDFSPEFFHAMAKTGVFYGPDTTTQEALDGENPTESGKALNTAGKDMHDEVSKEKLVQHTVERIIELNKSKQEPGGQAQQAEMALKNLRAAMKLFQAVGWLNTKGRSIDDILNITKLEGNENAFEFSRSMSKELTTVMLYGSSAQGASGHIAQELLRSIYNALSEKIGARVKAGDSPVIRRLKSARENLSGKSYVIDTETTGTNIDEDAVVQISIRELDNGRPTGKTETIWIRNDSGKSLPETLGNGQPNPAIAEYAKQEKAGNLLSKEDALGRLKEIVGTNPLVGHNIDSFDIPILNKNLGANLTNSSVDTLTLARDILDFNSNTLTDLTKSLGLQEEALGQAHLADVDTQMTAKLARFLADKGDEVIAEIGNITREKSNVDADFNGVTLAEISDALRQLITHPRDHYNKQYVDESKKTDINEYADSLVRDIPSTEELNDSDIQVSRGGRFFKRNDANHVDIRNFSVNAKGLQRISSALSGIFGEPAEAAVRDAIGADAKQGTKIPAAVGGILNILAQILQLQAIRDHGGNLNLTQSDRYNLDKLMRVLGPFFRFSSGVNVLVRKEQYSSQNPAIWTSAAGTPYIPSVMEIASATISAGPLVIQAVGDATMMLNTLRKLKKGTNAGLIYDGGNGDIGSAAEIGQVMNEASYEAQKALVLTDIYKTVEAVGKNLIKEGLTEKTDPIEAVVDCVMAGAQGKYLDTRRDIPDWKSKGKDGVFQVGRYLEDVTTEEKWEPSFIASLGNKVRQFFGGQYKAGFVEQQLKDFFTDLKLRSINERIKHEVLDGIPVSYHHISGMPETKFTVHNPLPPRTIFDEKGNVERVGYLDLLEQVNAKRDANHQLGDFYDLLSAYAETKRREIYNNRFKANLGRYEQSRFAQLTNMDNRINSANTLNEEQMQMVDEAFGKRSKVTPPANVRIPSKTYTNKALQRAFHLYAKDSNLSPVARSIARKVLDLLPEDVTVEIHRHVGTMPENVKKYFCDAGGQDRGLYIVENGVPKIYILPQAGKGIDYDSNAETIAHEAIHTVLSQAFTNYFNNPSVLTEEQKKAISNLESLLMEFMDTDVWAGESVPDAVRKLREILSNIEDPAQRLDELTAYALTNKDLLESFAQYKMDQETVDAHTKSLASLIQNLMGRVKHAWLKILNIVTGSALEKHFSASFDSVNNKLRGSKMDFMSLYGANTLVVLNEEVNQRNDGNRKNQKRTDVTRQSIWDRFSTYDSEISLNETIKQRAEVIARYRNTSLEEDEVTNAIAKKVQEEGNKVSQLASAFTNQFERIYGDPDLAESLSDLALNIAAKDAMTGKARYNLFRAAQALRQNINENFLVEDPNMATTEEVAYSKDMYDLLTGKSDFYDNIDRSNLPEAINPQAIPEAVFFSLVLMDQDISNALGKVRISQKEFDKLAGKSVAEIVKDSVDDPLGYYEQLAKAVVDSWVTKAVQDKNATEAITSVTTSDAKALSPGKFEKMEQTFEEGLRKVDNTFFTTIAKLIQAIPSYRAKAAGQFLQEWEQLRADSPIDMFNLVTEGLRKLVLTHTPDRFVNVLKELYGRTPSNMDVWDLITQIKGYYDKMRKLFFDDYPDYLQHKFTNTKMDKATKAFLHRTLATTDIQCLSQEEIDTLLLEKKSLSDIISSEEARLKSLAPDLFADYIKKIRQLANYLHGSREAGHNLLLNAYSIGALLGEGPVNVQANEQIINSIDKLITYHSFREIERQSKSDFARLKEIYRNDNIGMVDTISHLRQLHNFEMDKLAKLELDKWRYNYKKGSLSRGTGNKPNIVYATKRDVKTWRRKGYKVIGTYQKSNIDSSETIYRLKNDAPIEEAYNETLLQGINKTAFGFQITKGTREEIAGAQVQDPKVLEDIWRNYGKETSPNGVIPIWNDSGQVIGYDRALMPEDARYLDTNNDIFSGMAQGWMHAVRELNSDRFNHQAINYAWDDYANATEEEKRTQFVDVFTLNDPIVERGMARLDSVTKRLIRDKFGDHFYLRKDMVDLYLGHKRISILDIIDNSHPLLPKSVEDGLVKALDPLFGGRALYWIARAEQAWQAVMGYARNTIIVRSGIVAVINTLANTLQLHMVLGIPFNRIAQYYKDGITYTQQYNALIKEQQEIEYQEKEATNEKEKARLKERWNYLEREIQSLPIYPLIKKGEYSTISEGGAIYSDATLASGKIDEFLTDLIESHGGKGSTAKRVASEVLMTRNSSSYKFMASFVNQSDWIAKYTAFAYLTEKYGNRIVPETARGIATTLFVNYNIPMGPTMEYFNSMGLLWFFSWKLRMIPAAIFSLTLNPSRAILSTLFESAMPTTILGGTPLSENIFTKLFTGALSYSVGFGMAFRGILMHPLFWLLI